MGIFHVEKGKVVFQAEGGVFAKSFLMEREESAELGWGQVGKVSEEAKDIGLSDLDPWKP